ncbi:uncharacterized protein BP5553_08368 [Venustampulla echinocandica]|uniref:Uncharacterized protein n=1 Tax=Venustampulla echinocandica TaxID=2656787 RepID=A0A370TGI1_9HELO|nr:uncharacterized protein BP5553_08368 [Venustampulla echinocandica]RDL34000.1 hypothetical protein BP5553_08368 [Venustampulla echinocandica]
MPPKEETMIGLTPKETQMLSAVVSLMGDVPNVSFDEVARLCGHKYARNARTSCKKLFEKLKANAGNNSASCDTAKPDGAENSDGEEIGGAKKKTAPKAKKTPGARAAPKKAAAGMKKGTARKVIKKEPEIESEDEKFDLNMKEEDEEDHDYDHGHEMERTGKSEALAPVNEPFPAGFTSTMFGVEATFPPGYEFPPDATEEELYKAHTHEITVEEWRTWKIQNDYDDNIATTPITTSYSDEEDA